MVTIGDAIMQGLAACGPMSRGQLVAEVTRQATVPGQFADELLTSERVSGHLAVSAERTISSCYSSVGVAVSV